MLRFCGPETMRGAYTQPALFTECTRDYGVSRRQRGCVITTPGLITAAFDLSERHTPPPLLLSAVPASAELLL